MDINEHERKVRKAQATLDEAAKGCAGVGLLLGIAGLLLIYFGAC